MEVLNSRKISQHLCGCWTSIRISVRQGKLVKAFIDCSFGEEFYFQYLLIKKKNFKIQSFLFQIWRFKYSRKYFATPTPMEDPVRADSRPCLHGCWIPVSISIHQRKRILSFFYFLFGGQSRLQYLSMKINNLKSNKFSSRYGGSKLEEIIL
jgi:hypothetical protein